MSSRLPVVIAVLLVVVPWPGVALAQDPPVRIAVVDVQRVLTESEPGRERTATMESLQRQLRTQAETLQQELQALRTRISEREGAGAPESELAPLRQELDQKATELRRFGDQAGRDLQQRQEAVLQEFEAIVMPVLEAIGAEGDYTLVFRKFDSGFVYVAPRVDITDQVIARVNATARAGGGSP